MPAAVRRVVRVAKNFMLTAEGALGQLREDLEGV
jgi:hypothetical protein